MLRSRTPLPPLDDPPVELLLDVVVALPTLVVVLAVLVLPTVELEPTLPDVDEAVLTPPVVDVLNVLPVEVLTPVLCVSEDEVPGRMPPPNAVIPAITRPMATIAPTTPPIKVFLDTLI